ncbi:MAG: PAS domain S-box protein [Gammaproteobacteria bacterium]|nr:PAS domain S-box protein [Gammaproteobacteria bacterium]
MSVEIAAGVPGPEPADSRRISEDRLGALLDAAVDPIVLIDPAGRITLFNRAAERVFGYAAAEVIGKNVSTLMPAPYRDEHDRYLQRYLRTGTAHIIGVGREVIAQRKDGRTFPVDLSVGEFRSGSERGFVGVLRDISLRKQQEQEIHRINEELRLIFDSTPTATTITDHRGVIVNANRASETLLGYAPEALAGVHHSELILDQDRGTVRENFDRLRETGERFQCEVRYLTRSGHALYALLNAGVARDAQGMPLLMVCEIHDRSALFAAAQEVEELHAKLMHVSRIGLLGEMASGIAHEVNQPLAAIASYASAARRMLLGGMSDQQELATVLDKIAAQSDRAGKVIRGLRNLARKREAVSEPVDCRALIQEVLRLVEFELRAKGLRVLLNLEPVLPVVQGDGVQIQQVVLNLIQNAIEAMGESASCDYLEITASAPDAGWIEISVSDCGPGLAEGGEARLFEPFFTTKPQGTGLGLSICKSITNAHGGELHYRRNDHGGAEFIMRLPSMTRQ